MKTNTILFLVLTTVSCLLLLQYYYYTSNLKSIPDETVQIRNILYWTQMFGRADFNLGLGSEIFEGCEVSNCYATANRSYLPIDQFDAILFHGNEYISDKDHPGNRSQDQYYIYSNQESPIYTSRWLGSKNFFNWTMTYRSDSDIMRPYGYYEKTTTNYKMPTVEEVQGKPHKIAWMVSNCHAISNRNDLYRKLNKYVPIDVYGSCGDKYCSKDDFEGCYDFLAKNYKFYLSFENSICEGYATEKLFAALMRDLVPIAYGGADYSKIAPPNSVIDVTKFSSIGKLAEHLKTLDENPDMYLSYLKWKTKYVVRRDNKLTLCTLCKKLNRPVDYKSYTRIDQWWNSGKCRIFKWNENDTLLLDYF